MKPEKIIELVVTQLQITREGTLRYNLNNAITMDEVDQKLQTLANLHAYLEKGFPRQSSSSPATHYSDAAKALNTLFLSNEKEKNEGWGDNSKDWTEVKTELDRITKYLRDRKAEMVAASAPKEATRSEQWKQKRASMSNDESSSSYDTDSPSYDNEINEHPTIRELNDQKMEAFSILTKFGPMFYGRKLNNDVEIDEELTSDEKLAQLEEAREQKVQYEYLCHVEKVVQDYESRIDWVRKKLHSLPVHSRNTVVEAPPAKVELKSFDAFTNPETKKTGHDVNAKKSNASSSSSYKSDSKHSAKADNGSVPEAPPMAPPMSNNSKSVATKTYSTAKSTPSKAPIAKAAASASSSKPHSNAAPVKGHNLDMNAARGKLAAAFAQDKANQHARASSASSSSSAPVATQPSVTSASVPAPAPTPAHNTPSVAAPTCK